MCGIYGKIHFQGSLSVSESVAALNLLEHRGPDGYGFEYGDLENGTHVVHHNAHPEGIANLKCNYFIGHRRLSIVDLNDNAFQPMESFCKRYSITFNGEIYNYIELKKELLALGCEFSTDHSDTEVLLNSYVTWGEECVKRLHGMFAFAILDRKNNLLFLARDRIGQKTVYYELTNGAFQFASEIGPMIQFGEKRHINPTALGLYLLLGYVPYPHSIFEDILKLPPATFAKIDLKHQTIALCEYWDLDSTVYDGMDMKLAKKQAELSLREAVAYRLRADVSFGAFISGGTDSTLIVKNIADLADARFDVYGADFPGTTRSERKYMTQAANRYRQNLKVSEIDLTHIEKIRQVVDVFDEPFDGASAIALFDLFRVAGQDHKIILTGDGGDEMFAGYTRYVEFPARDRLVRALRRLKLPAIILSVLAKIGITSSRMRSLRTMLAGNTINNFTGLNKTSPLTKLLRPQFRQRPSEYSGVFSAIGQKIEEKGFSPTKALQYLELKTILPGRMLYKLDRFSMHYSVEARSPFLDHRLAKMAFSVPDTLNIQNGETKVVLKELLTADFDHEFVYRKKEGFGNPLSNWFKGKENENIFLIFRNESNIIFQFLDFGETAKKVRQLRSSCDSQQDKLLWRLLVLAHYFQNHKDRIAKPH